MAVFPDIYPTVWDPDWERFEEIDRARSGRLQVNQWDPVRHFGAKASWSTLTRARYDQIEDHWCSYDGSSFTLFNFRLRKLRDVFVVVANGSSLIYDLPGKEIVGLSIKHNNVVAGTQPTRLVGTGLEGRDQIQYTSGTKPANGVVLTASASDGRQAFDANYGNVKFPDRHRTADIWIAEAEFVVRVVA
jgi:hypothetical protein